MYTKRLNWRNVVAIAISSAVLMAFSACDETNNGLEGEKPDGQGKTVEVTKVTINPPASVDLDAGGKSITLTVTIEPANATDKTVTWSSSNTSIATVSATGIVTGVGEGTVTITATSKNGNKEAEYTLTVKPDPTKQPVELKSPIRENTTLKDLGMEVDYFYAADNLLVVENNATLTIEPGVTIRFSNNGRGGGIDITSGSTIKAVGTASKRIQFIGAYDAPGTWQGITTTSNTDNQFAYCDFLNMGHSDRTDYGGIQLSNGAKVGFSHCKFTNGLGTGLRASSYGGACQFTAFDNNVFEGYENNPPMVLTPLALLEKFDMTSDFTKNAKQYIQVNPVITKDITINQTTVPYYFSDQIAELNNTLTINEGVTIYMKTGMYSNFINSGGAGRLVINGTASKKVKITRLPGNTTYWGTINFTGLKGSVINHCIIEYGGRDGLIGMLCCSGYESAELTLNNVEIKNAETYGATVSCGAKITHSNVTFSNCGLGNVHDFCSHPYVIRTHFP
jgi:hypothetical protein